MESEVPTNGVAIMQSRKSLAPEKKQIARKRWELLINVLTNKKHRLSNVSVRRFASFGLVQTEALEHDSEMTVNSLTGHTIERRHIWYRYTKPEIPGYQAIIRHLDGSLDIKDVLGFNNTGNVCVWPSEEVLTHYCLQHKELFRDKRVCELGGGMTCLAGLAVAQCTEAAEVLLTDGNVNSVENVKKVLERNSTSFHETSVSARVLRWNDVPSELHCHYDIIICADCLFFDEYRKPLIDGIYNLLRPGGCVIIFAPSRGETFQLFKDLIDDRFQDISHTENYDDGIWELHKQNLQKGLECYDPNIHYPMMLCCSKRTTTTGISEVSNSSIS